MKRPERVVLDDATVLPSKGTCCTAQEGRTVQADAGAADINLLLKRSLQQGVLPAQLSAGMYADVSGISDFRSALESVRRGEEAFMSLDADVRSAFENDPAQFVEAFQSEEGRARLRELKVLPPTAEELADRREGAAEERAEKRAALRRKVQRMKAAEAEPSPLVPPKED